MTNEYQTRSEQTGIELHDTLVDAFYAAQLDPTIWKISYSNGEKRVRLVRKDSSPNSEFVEESIEKFISYLVSKRT